jgi:hypothetical protein
VGTPSKVMSLVLSGWNSFFGRKSPEDIEKDMERKEVERKEGKEKEEKGIIEKILRKIRDVIKKFEGTENEENVSEE